MPERGNELAVRMSELDATDAEVGELIGRNPEQVEAMRKGDAEIDAAARILLRPFLADDPHAAKLALYRLRHTFHRTYAGGDRAALENTVVTIGPAVIDGAHYGGSQ